LSLAHSRAVVQEASHRGDATFDSRSVRMKFVVDQGHWDGGFSEYFDLSLSISFYQCSLVIFIYMLLLPEGRTGEAWVPSKKQCSYGNRRALDITVLPLSL